MIVKFFANAAKPDCSSGLGLCPIAAVIVVAEGFTSLSSIRKGTGTDWRFFFFS